MPDDSVVRDSLSLAGSTANFIQMTMREMMVIDPTVRARYSAVVERAVYDLTSSFIQGRLEQMGLITGLTYKNPAHRLKIETLVAEEMMKAVAQRLDALDPRRIHTGILVKRDRPLKKN